VKEKEREVGELGIQVKTIWRRWLAAWLVEQCVGVHADRLMGGEEGKFGAIVSFQVNIFMDPTSREILL